MLLIFCRISPGIRDRGRLYKRQIPQNHARDSDSEPGLHCHNMLFDEVSAAKEVLPSEEILAPHKDSPSEKISPSQKDG